jgi:hypothetical protein
MPIISDFDYDVVTFGARGDDNEASALNRMNRIIDDISPNLIELTSADLDVRQILREVRFQLYAFQLVLKDRERALESIMYVDLLHGASVNVGVGFHRLHQITYSS